MSTNSIWVSISCADLAMARDLVEPRVGHRDPADIGLDRAERIIGRLRRRGFGQRIEKRRFADVRQADDAAAKAHDLSESLSSLRAERSNPRLDRMRALDQAWVLAMTGLRRALGEIEADAQPLAPAGPRQHFVPQPAFPHQQQARTRLDGDEGVWRRGGAAIISGRRGSSKRIAPEPVGTST